ncbi:MFS transporter, partial [Oenococcus oeni]|uniref:MFS transporter n=1 Tax=Oenococcus oeni TaxID=1247 RepID=UPI00214C964F
MFFLANRIKRRLAWIGGFCFTTTILAAIAILSHYAAGLSILPYIVITCTMLFVFVDQMTLGPVCWLLLSEIFPLHVRGLGVGIATFGMWIMDFGVGFFFPILIEIFGLSNTFWIFAVIGVICIIISFFIIPLLLLAHFFGIRYGLLGVLLRSVLHLILLNQGVITWIGLPINIVAVIV